MKSKCITFFNLIPNYFFSTSVFANTHCHEHGEAGRTSMSKWDEKITKFAIYIGLSKEDKIGTYYVGQINNQGDLSGYGHWYGL